MSLDIDEQASELVEKFAGAVGSMADGVVDSIDTKDYAALAAWAQVMADMASGLFQFANTMAVNNIKLDLFGGESSTLPDVSEPSTGNYL